MKVGLDAFTIREVSTDPIEQLKFAKKLEFDGIQFDEACYLGKDISRLREIKSFADENGLYTHVSVDVINPLFHKITVEENAAIIADQIKTFAQIGWHELRTRMGGLDERGQQHREVAAKVMKIIYPVLKECGSRINFENHGDCTTFEIIHIIEQFGEDVAGINLDTANTMVHAEDPLLAVKRCAPYINTTHAKDGILFFTEKGMTRQVRPAGAGVVEWEKILPILYANKKDLTLSIEDHKWLFEVDIFNEAWVSDHPDLNAYELGQLVKKTWSCSRKIFKGEIQDPVEYEKTPFIEEMIDRIVSAKNYLKNIVKKL